MNIEAEQRRRLVALARRWLSGGSEAEDLVQEACLRAIAGPLPPGDAGRQAWLVTVLRHLCIDHLRRGTRYRGVLAREEAERRWGMADDDIWPERLAARAQRVDMALSRLVATLPPAGVAVLLLHEVFEIGHAELGALIGRSEVASRQYLHRLQRRLQAALASPPSADDETAGEDAAWLLALCRQALVRRDPDGLVALLRGSGIKTSASAAARCAASVPRDPGGHTVRVQGLLALLVYMDGGFVACLPLDDAGLLAA